tara:strand:- start:3055 stop:3732 length:678 start_codon:yes stop_codon:yes gene_type:complete
MADSDYTVAVVLQASDEGMSKTLKQTGDDVEDLGKKSKKTQAELLTTIVALEGLTSGLNQVTGGARKFSAAMVETGKFTREQADEFNRYIGFIELATGPLESIIAFQKLFTISSAIFTTQQIRENDAKGKSIIVNKNLGLSWLALALPLLAVVAIFATLYYLFTRQEEITKSLKEQIDAIKGVFASLNVTGRATVAMFSDLASGASAAIDPLQRVVGFIPGIGGD